MFGKRNRNNRPDGFDPYGGLPEDEEYIPGDYEGGYVPEEYGQDYAPQEYADGGTAGSGGSPAEYEDGYVPGEYTEKYTNGYSSEEYAEEYPDGYAPDEYAEGYAPDEYAEEYADEYVSGGIPDSEPAGTYAHSIFRPATRKPNFIVSVLVNTARVLFLLVFLAGVAGIGALAGIAKGYVDTSPELDLVALASPDQNTVFYDCYGNELAKYYGTENREVVSLDAIPMNLQNAFIAVEDTRFYSHNGIDLKRIGGALISNLTTSGTQGGSTITQQLIKNTLLSSEQSYKRKIQEAWLAIRLEMNARYTKDDILGSYLNTIYMGESYYGVKVAAMGYFGKDLDKLTLRECAMLAGMTNNPYYYNPRRNFYSRRGEDKDFPSVTNDRTDYVLECMLKNQYITKEQYDEAMDYGQAHVLAKEPQSSSGEMYHYPHYIEYAVKEAIQILLEINKLPDTQANRAAMEDKLRTGGFRIKLAIDRNIQETVEKTLQTWSQYPSLRDPSDKVFRTRNADGTYTDIQEPQAACAVLDYRTGELKAIVGSRNEVKARKTLNRATDMKMPVGSSIKPISVYAPALERGASPASVVFNIPVPVPGWAKDARGNDTWPTNYGGGGYTGPETLRTAMKKSHNTSAAWTLLTLVGMDGGKYRSVNFLNQMGIDDGHIDPTPFGLSLGSSGITPLQMTVAFGVLANGGMYMRPISVIGISDADGQVVWDGKQHQMEDRRRVFSSSTAYMIVDMLKTAVSSGTGTAAKIKDQVVGGKTGTNSDQRGVFFAGITGYYSSALWIGHDNYKPLASKSTGSNAAAPLWKEYMSQIHQGLANNKEILEGTYRDYGLVRIETCAVSGQLATDACRNDAMGYGTTEDFWAEGTQPTQYCQMHTEQMVCPDSGMIASPYCPSREQKGVVVIPYGHPLYSLIGTEYQKVLEEYLGLSLAYGTSVCTLHTEGGYPGGGDSGGGGSGQALPEQRVAAARDLISFAQEKLRELDPNGGQYLAIVEATMQLQSLIDSGTATQADLTNAMTTLTRAMAGLY